MASRPVRPDIPSSAAAARPKLTLPGGVVTLGNADWFQPIAVGVKLRPGAVAPTVLRVPVADAQKVIGGIVHLVADIRGDAPPTVVWVASDDELFVYLDRVRIACASGLVTISLVVACDEIKGAQRVDVGFGVGTPKQPAGLVMSTFDRVQGPPLIADTWSAAITAFAWEALVTVAEQLAAAMGKDAAGRPLVPATITAEPDVLLVGAMARNNLTPTRQ